MRYQQIKRFMIIMLASFFSLSIFSAAGAISLEQKVGQMIMIAFYGDSRDGLQVKELEEELESGRLGGVIISGSNVKSPSQFKQLMAPILKAAKAGQKKTGQAVLFSIDQEGGAVSRLNAKKGFTQYPSPFDVMKKNDPAKASKLWKKMACELKDYGVNLNLAPVVDLNIVPNSPAIGRWGRSFSKHPNKVVKWAEIFLDAHKACGVLTSLKHFPGHGSALGDTHEGFVDVSKTWQPNELEPYKALIAKNKVDIIMSAHVVNKKWSPMPASLSPEVMDGLLRKKMGYKGVIITDDLMMGAIDKFYSFSERIVQAVKAGSDIVLIAAAKNPDTDNARSARKAILAAVKRGEISAERIDQSYRRIARLKKKL